MDQKWSLELDKVHDAVQAFLKSTKSVDAVDRGELKAYPRHHALFPRRWNPTRFKVQEDGQSGAEARNSGLQVMVIGDEKVPSTGRKT